MDMEITNTLPFSKKYYIPHTRLCLQDNDGIAHVNTSWILIPKCDSFTDIVFDNSKKLMTINVPPKKTVNCVYGTMLIEPDIDMVLRFSNYDQMSIVQGKNIDLCKKMKNPIDISLGPADETDCVDSDGGINPSISGFVLDSFNRYKDECQMNGILAEYHCDNGFVNVVVHKCKSLCVDGAC